MKPDKEVLFRKILLGVYFYNTSDRDVLLINTVLEIRGGLCQREYDATNQALHELSMVGYGGLITW